MPLDSLQGWRDALGPWMPTSRPMLDVGAGTGLWSIAFVQWFDVSVVAIEPSDAMRRRAIIERPHHHIAYAGGRAERLPLRDSAFGSAWLSTVVHHVSDLHACAAELRRVLAPGGTVLIRNTFSDRADEIPWLRWFPEARPAALQRWPTVATVVETFAAVGFSLIEVRRVREATAPHLGAYARRVRVRVDSTLAAIPDAEFERGIRAMERAAAGGTQVEPIVTGLDLLVLR